MINKLERKFGRYAIRGLMKYIMLLYGLGLIMFFVSPEFYSNWLSLDVEKTFLHFQLWRLITFLIQPIEQNNIFFVLITMYLYYFIGNMLEMKWGSFRFNLFYFSGVLFNILLCVLIYVFTYFVVGTGISVGVGLEYINLAMFFAFAVYFPDLELLVFFILPIKIKYLAWLNAAFFVYGILTASFPENLLPVVAMLNFCVFCGGELLRMLRGRKTTKQAVSFRREARRIRYEQAQKLYNHKCAVCGRTDTDHPELEFRYCSRCAGYHCFCQDHINNHIHFTE